MANRLGNPNIQYLDSSGNVLTSGTLTFVVTGTSTPATTYSDTDLLTANANPVVLDSAGRAGHIFLNPAVTYGVTLKNSAGTTIWTADPVVDPAANVTAAVQAYAGNPNGFVAGNAGSVGGSGVSAVYDITNDILYFCTTTGGAAVAVWTGVTGGTAALDAANVFTETQTISSTDAGAAVGPILVLDRDSATPAAADIIGGVRFDGEDSAGNDQVYMYLQGTIVDPTSTSEDGKLVVQTVVAGTVAARMHVGAGTWMQGAVGGDPGVGKINAVGFQVEGVAFGPAVNNAFSAAQTISLASSAAVPLELVSTNADSIAGPILSLYRNSASPVDEDGGGGIHFYGKDSGSNKIKYGAIDFIFEDITDATEDGRLLFSLMKAGVDTVLLNLLPTGLLPQTSNGLDIGGPSNFWNVGYLTTIELGHASANTLSASGGVLSIEGVAVANTTSATHADALLDTLGTEANGALIYHNGSVWAVLAPP